MTGPVELAKAVRTPARTPRNRDPIMDRIVGRSVDHEAGGVPCVRGNPHPVATVAGLLARGRVTGEVLQHYSQLTAQGCAIPAGPNTVRS